MPATPPPHATDAAMLNWLAGDVGVTAAANRIWEATGQLTDATAAVRAAQNELEAATDAYSEAIRVCRIPAEHAERLGAALILRIGRSRILAELDGFDGTDGGADGDAAP
ncbi:hypothetical protein [Catenulispora pinisilvae]|uniref:hypothetical protein n=1 Tax=Catenulispora pinisilvae TaxID=2705253 RepID=UPI001891D24C|nr:hypothetical protein [Catenulispora pinisilvae]